jgi:hypothetical protein
MKKRFLYLLVAVFLGLVLSSCGRNATPASGSWDRDNDNRQNTAGGMSQAAQNRARFNVSADPAAFLASLTEEVYNAVLNNISTSSDLIANITDSISGGLTGRVSTTLSFNVNQRQVERWSAEFPELRDIMGLVYLLLDSGVSLEATYSMDANDLSGALNLAWLLNNQRILNLEAIMTNNTLFLGIPELYNRYIKLDALDLGFDFVDIMQALQGFDSLFDGLFDEFFDELSPLFDMLLRHETTLHRTLGEITQAALGEIKNITVNNNVTVDVNHQPVRYTEMVVVITELDLANAARAGLQAFRYNDAAINMVVDFINFFDGGMYFTPQEIREELDMVIADFNPLYFDNSEVVSFQIFLDPNTNAFTGIQFEADDTYFRFFFDFAHGFELTVDNRNSWSPSYFVVRGNLNGRADNFSGDVWIEYSDRWTQYSGRLATFDIRFSAIDRFTVRISGSVGDWFQIGGLNPHSILPSLFAEYVNNAEVILVMESTPNASRFSLELLEPVNGLSAKLEMTAEENVRVNINAPHNTLSLNEIDVLLGRDLLTILGNVSNLIERIEGMGYDVSVLDELISEMLW